MNKNRLIAFCLFAVAFIAMNSCAVAPHPNEKIIVGIWKPVKVEPVIDSSALKARISRQADTTRMNKKPGKEVAAGNGIKKEVSIERLIQIEMRTTLEIFANKTAVKNYPKQPLRVTWKMKARGKRIVAKNLANKSKTVIDILEISQGRIVVLEHAKKADVKITYERQK